MTTNGQQISETRNRPRRLRIYNVVMGLLHAAQGAAVLALANGFTLPVVASYMTGPPGAGEAETVLVFDLSFAWGVAAFLFLSAIAHFAIASPGIYPWYRRNLANHRNYARWIEYSLSSSVMVVLIAMLVGIADIAALLALAGVNASMILFGLLQEKYETPGKNVSWVPYWFGVIAGAVPWLAIAWYLFSPGFEASPPGFVYGIFVSLFLFFNVFAVVMVLQYKKVGHWADYEFGESTYVLLSLLAKSALAWQVFGGTLAA
ncbi:MAG: heliorhodopsin HeR [Acidimicrobiia bacterium]|nr:heliorhodopsin HeR [Acidimicrobiia bacterium]MDH3462185.1 heliorhodopsin HeR [Acidimicrobiia bacterium]